VFTFGRPRVKSVNRIKVKGIFYKEKHVGKYTFHNEVDASEIKIE
jgi:hypothetical protein